MAKVCANILQDLTDLRCDLANLCAKWPENYPLLTTP